VAPARARSTRGMNPERTCRLRTMGERHE
jgi:hypothetical protein